MQKPNYLNDYVCTNTYTQHWCNLVSYHALNASHHYIAAIHDTRNEPKSYVEASKDPQWISAMENEIQALVDNQTWEVVDLPKGKKAIGFKWVYKVKLKSDGSLERFKARLVTKGFNQKYGVDFEETFSPVIKMTTFRCLLAIAASHKWVIHQLDINNAFLHGDLYEEVYMRMPEGIPNPHNQVCLLKKSLYGLKQASRQWHAKLVSALKELGFIQLKNDYSLFTKNEDDKITILAVYVDDILITGSSEQEIITVKQYLYSSFTIKDLGALHYFLGIEVSYSDQGMTLTQQKYSKDLLQESGVTSFHKVATPLPKHLKLFTNEGDLFHDPTLYRKLIGKLNFLTHTRPDLSYTI